MFRVEGAANQNYDEFSGLRFKHVPPNMVPSYMLGKVYSPPSVDRIWSTWGSYYNVAKALFYLLTGDYIPM